MYVSIYHSIALFELYSNISLTFTLDYSFRKNGHKYKKGLNRK